MTCMQTQGDFAGKAVVVTGGTRGIGAGIARGFLQAGAEVLVCGRTPPAQDADLPEADGRYAQFSPADVCDPHQAGRMITVAKAKFGRVDVLICNAGGSPEAAAATASPRFHQKIIELNLIAPLQCAQAVNAVMQSQDQGGAIIMIGSVSGSRPSPGTAASDAAAGHYGDEATSAAVAKTVPLQRMATPADVAAACLFLAAPEASYISGASLLVHGGGEPPAFLAVARGSLYPPESRTRFN